MANAKVEVGSAIILAIALTLLFFVLLRLIRRSRSAATRIAAAVSIVAALLVSPFLFDFGVTTLNRSTGIMRVMIDPGWPIKIAPGVLGVFLAALIAKRADAHHQS